MDLKLTLVSIFYICTWIYHTKGVMEYTFDTVPLNSAVQFGRSIVLTCTMKEPGVTITWYNPSSKIVAMNDKIAKGYDVMWTKLEEGQSKLCVLYAEMSSAGEYMCQADHDGKIQNASAQIIVLETDKLQCIQFNEILVEGEDLMILCEMRYAGLWAPALEWQTVGSNPFNSIENETDGTTARLRLTTTASREFYMVPFKCIGQFDHLELNTSLGYASNSPTFLFTPCTVWFDIHWPPTESRIKILSEKRFYCEGETVSCIADTNPLAAYIRWRGPDDEILSNTPSLKIGGKCQPSCYCEVGNYVGPVGQQEMRVARRYLKGVIGTKSELYESECYNFLVEARSELEVDPQVATTGDNGAYGAGSERESRPAWFIYLFLCSGHLYINTPIN